MDTTKEEEKRKIENSRGDSFRVVQLKSSSLFSCIYIKAKSCCCEETINDAIIFCICVKGIGEENGVSGANVENIRRLNPKQHAKTSGATLLPLTQKVIHTQVEIDGGDEKM